MKNMVLLLAGIVLWTTAAAQSGKIQVNGKFYPYTIDECGDTLIMASLDGVSITSPALFDNAEDYKRYQLYRRYAAKVYPYAVEAIKLFREVESETDAMKKRHRKRYVRDLHKGLKDEFTDPLKSLTKTQGMILIKMIERELDTPMYDLIKNLRGGLTATYWNTVGSFFGHHIKEGYTPGEDDILDAVLQDFDISYDLPKE